MRKIALVTGGSRGIGKAIVDVLSEVFDVYYTYHSASSEAAKIESEFIHPLKADSHDYEAIQRVVAEIVQHGTISILINNAGITKDKTCRKMTKNEWDDVISINLNAAFYYSQACLQPMIDGGWGRIVNISSIIGLTGGFGQSNYAAAKAGLIGFSKSLAMELAIKNITVNAISPGYVETHMTKQIPESIKTSLLEKIPMRRFGTTSEVASLVRYLVSEDSSYITGQVFCVSGGL
ncbi:3-oxoacyl-ACP reductase FabG [Sphaerochaeta sp. S2]|uniref:3-oxoacyl-ACP reductase FabG n=1 Tax=Sphaerochaeta sp. S2 TaxID=2798868 RepID=UPI0018E9E7EC|nr:3-oxoacyl-ACP reductase FabG [Sphaerochaeta sp. S2]MBJ2357875.1 3-oxoacyl-ACP reductase FabG [Sphaerochaeta sp. S2]